MNLIGYIAVFFLTNKCHVAVHLSCNRSQMTSKCCKNKKVAHEAIAECVTDDRKTCDCGQPGGHSIRVLTERKGALVTEEICVLCGRWFSNQFEIVSETPFSCDTVGRELYFARCCAVSWTGTFASESKVICSVYLTLRSDVLIFCIPKQQSVCQGFFATEKTSIY